MCVALFTSLKSTWYRFWCLIYGSFKENPVFRSYLYTYGLGSHYPSAVFSGQPSLSISCLFNLTPPQHRRIRDATMNPMLIWSSVICEVGYNSTSSTIYCDSDSLGLCVSNSLLSSLMWCESSEGLAKWINNTIVGFEWMVCFHHKTENVAWQATEITNLKEM